MMLRSCRPSRAEPPRWKHLGDPLEFLHRVGKTYRRSLFIFIIIIIIIIIVTVITIIIIIINIVIIFVIIVVMY